MLNNSLTFSLFKIYMKNIFSLNTFLESFKKGPKAVLKNIFIILAFLYCFGMFGFYFIQTSLAYYNIFEEAGNPKLLLLFGLCSASLVIIFFGFISVIGNYYTGNGEEQIRALPLKAKNIFCAKYGISLVSDASFGFFIFAIIGIIYGFKNGLLINPLFYVGLIVLDLALSIFTIFVIYLVLVLILTAFPVLRKKSFLTAISTICIFVFILSYSLFTSRMGIALETDSQDFLQPLTQVFLGMAQKLPFLFNLTKCIEGNWLVILLVFVVEVAFAYFVVPSIAGLYIKTLNGFSDVKTKHLNKTEAASIVKKEIKSSSIAKALYLRDLKMVLREPTFFSNGPLILFLMPGIMIGSFIIGFTAASDVSIELISQELRDLWFAQSAVQLERVKFFVVLASAGFAAFIGNGTNIASTSFSREGKNLYVLKAMPLENVLIAQTKFWHAFTYNFIAIIITAIMEVVLCLLLSIPLSAIELVKMIAYMAILSSAVSLVLVFTELFLDTANPKLEWENPIAAVKQNLNSIISVFITIAVVGLVVGIGFVVPKNTTGILIMTVIFVIIGAPLGSLYYKYATKKITVMGEN